MNTTFNPARSAALRQQLGALPTTEPAHSSTTLRRYRDKPEEQHTQFQQRQQSKPTKRRRAPWIIGGAGVAVTAALLASGPFQPGSTTGADFVPAMARPQQPEDLLPEDLQERDRNSPTGVDAATSRLVGAERGYSYYAAESNDGMMCLVVVFPTQVFGVEAPRSPWEVACTPLANFDSAPLQLTSATTNTKVWLVSANIEPTEEQLTQQTRLSPNLYIEYTDGIPRSPAEEAGYDY
ncbi:hypothetical protein [Arthrobacter burdickii]|uniref:Uncharacterized protein n=1 Tax=Arthrobacter burdickii TaxID=3035920 RepID=A0ABT8JWR4_9MICC|nr:hypothetical protein [Arthrobacter burdickii]MDN4609600.1 hypothetical protein [Arthrobacter burdickii]